MRVRGFAAVLILSALAACGASSQLMNHPTPYARESSACGVGVACEGSDRNALAVNLVHFRSEEASRAQTAGRNADCQTAAHAAMAIARGLLATRAYELKKGARPLVYRTRFGGDLPERAALDGVKRDAMAAGASWRACGGPMPITITAKEQWALFGGSPENKESNRSFWTSFGKAAAGQGQASGGGGGGDGDEGGGGGEEKDPNQDTSTCGRLKYGGAEVKSYIDCCRGYEDLHNGYYRCD